MTKENYKIGALRARFADETMPWTRAHIEGLIDQIEQLTQQRDEGWKNFYVLRKRMADERYPGMTAIVNALEPEARLEWQTQCDKCEGKSSVGKGRDLRCPCGGILRDLSPAPLWDCACNLSNCPYCGPRMTAEKSNVALPECVCTTDSEVGMCRMPCSRDAR